MAAKFETLRFSEAYGFADFVWLCFAENMSAEELDSLLDPRDKEVEERLVSPHTDTLLHLLLRRLYEDTFVAVFEHHRNDMLDLVAQEYEAVLRYYEVPFKKRPFPDETHPDYDRLADDYISYLRLHLPIGRIAQDTFQLLFRDRAFLLRFNVVAARAVSRLAPGDPLKRAQPPAWLRRGVFYRDNGRCVKCGTDLTGVVISGDAVHYDHIIPLGACGSNDPTNFQTLCADCNLRKGKSSATWERYPTFWSQG